MLLKGEDLEVFKAAKQEALKIAKRWFLEIQAKNFDVLLTEKSRNHPIPQLIRKKLLEELLTALSVLLPEYEEAKIPANDNAGIDPIVAWFCATYGWYYYSFQRKKIELMDQYTTETCELQSREQQEGEDEVNTTE